MPWSAKAQELLDRQYAPVGAAAQAGLTAAETALAGAVARGVDVEGMRETFADRRVMADQYVAAYRQYCWTVDSLDDYRIAPFHLLATEGRVHADKDHVWHMEALKTHCDPDGEPVLQGTKYRLVDLAREKDVSDAIDWWVAMTEAGGEGMVVKPKAFVTLASRGLVQPAVKCRGREYLRIIYGPEYTRPEYLNRLKKRGLGRKRSLPRASSRSASRGWSASSRTSRCAESTSASSACWRWKASRWTRGSRVTVRPRGRPKPGASEFGSRARAC